MKNSTPPLKFFDHDLLGEVLSIYPELESYFFEKNYDYCHLGGKTLGQVSQDLHQNFLIFNEEISRQVLDTQIPSLKDFRNMNHLSQLVENIIRVYHEPLNRQLKQIFNLLEMCLKNHGEKIDGLHNFHDVFKKMMVSTQAHMITEEENIFPILIFLDYCHRKNIRMPEIPGGSLKVSIDRLEWEHIRAEKSMIVLKEHHSEFKKASFNCWTLNRALLKIAELESSLKEHILVENQILIPMAYKIEAHVLEAVSKFEF